MRVQDLVGKKVTRVAPLSKTDDTVILILSVEGVDDKLLVEIDRAYFTDVGEVSFLND